MTINPTIIRRDFPIFQRQVHPGFPLVYLDSAATTQKPEKVISAMDHFYFQSYANIHRGIHTLAEESTFLFENARETISKFINSPRSDQIIFTRNTTEAINLLANTLEDGFINKGDVILLSEMEHHSNLIPWQMLSSRLGIKLEFIPVTMDGILDMDSYSELLFHSPRVVSITAVSNVLGTVNPIKEMTLMAHDAGAIVIIDGAQAVPHNSFDVQDIDADFLAFSAHKMLGPTGIGVLYGKKNLLEELPPFMGGGDMIKSVRLNNYVPNALPHKFEAGTPAIAEAVGFGAAIEYLESIGMEAIASFEKELIKYAMEQLEEIKGVNIFGPPAEKRGGVISFTLEGVHPHDVAQLLDAHGVAVRAGHHCAQPLHEKFGITATTRASFYIYSTKEDVDCLVSGLKKVKSLFS